MPLFWGVVGGIALLGIMMWLTDYYGNVHKMRDWTTRSDFDICETQIIQCETRVCKTLSHNTSEICNFGLLTEITG